jgi:hypothetical protein
VAVVVLLLFRKVLREAKKNEVTASKDESERGRMEDGGHDSIKLSADSMLYGPK